MNKFKMLKSLGMINNLTSDLPKNDNKHSEESKNMKSSSLIGSTNTIIEYEKEDELKIDDVTKKEEPRSLKSNPLRIPMSSPVVSQVKLTAI